MMASIGAFLLGGIPLDILIRNILGTLLAVFAYFTICWVVIGKVRHCSREWWDAE